MMCGNGKMNNSLATLQFSVGDFEHHGLTAIAADCTDDRVRADRRDNPECIPNTNAPVRLPASVNPEGRGYGAEWVGRPDMAVVRGQDQNLARCEQS